nr:YqcC family protein [Kistimonas asteriae]
MAELEAELKGQALWEAMPPSPEALASTNPFCVDTLAFTQWLQWIYIPRLRAIMDHGAALPTGSDIKPYAEEAIKPQQIEHRQSLLELIGQLDWQMR